MISIHAPRGGSDALARGQEAAGCISIHAPRGGSDLCKEENNEQHEKFQSTLPVGGATTVTLPVPLIDLVFQSTLPVGGATEVYADPRHSGEFQSTLPVGGATSPYTFDLSQYSDFNPRSPWGERRVKCA